VSPITGVADARSEVSIHGGGPGMAIRQNTQQPPARIMRQFGWLLAGGLALLGNYQAPSPTALWLLLAGAAVFAVATVRPSAMRPILSVFLFIFRPLAPIVNWFAKPNNERRPPTRRRRIADTGT